MWNVEDIGRGLCLEHIWVTISLILILVLGWFDEPVLDVFGEEEDGKERERVRVAAGSVGRRSGWSEMLKKVVVGKEKLGGVSTAGRFSGGSRWRREGEIKGRGCRSLVRRGGRLCGGDYGGFNGVAPVCLCGKERQERRRSVVDDFVPCCG
ncbi:hypothetical protein HAX54_010466 [Datura stramonium]|uniref:Transmembrane protein n=1 Tax=Datura stramonium TaxID=4076 RepID=A0ABS8X047_DATST|nr:hypothetical protein [Datura stramonium]